MDQAIASAPTEDGIARLDVAQIRELMGTVPNAVFERILEAVNANQSAEVITVANQLLDAGNSPAQLARQCVRYLRNCVIAKITNLNADGSNLDGPAAELLQISPDEQRRAARSASLFSEEELTRFLQTMLRTFDELGYRQEQRFHFELGLLKLVHLRRLLPIEEVLSKFSASPAAATPKPSVSAASASASVRATPAFTPMQATPRSATPVPEPLAAPAPISTPVPTPAPESSLVEEVGAPYLASEIREAAPQIPILKPSEPQPTVHEPASVRAVLPDIYASETVPSSAPDPDHLQQAAVDALMSAKSQATAGDAIADSEFSLTGSDLTIQTTFSKTMLPTVINPEAGKVLRAAIQSIASGLKITILPVTAATKSTALKKPRAAASGSAQARAMKHPIVQEAQRLFNAEIRNVIDLTPND